METMNNQPRSNMGPQEPVTPPPVPKSTTFPTGKKELIYALPALIFGMMMCNCVIYGGFALGFAIALCGYILCASGYLLSSGGRLNGYSGVLLGLSILIAAGFGRSADGFVKFVMLCFLTVSVNLGLCLMAGQNHHTPGSVASLADARRTVFHMGYGQIPKAVGGLFATLKTSGGLTGKLGSVAIGLVILIPLLGIVVSLLIKADAAFENLMDLLPQFDLEEILYTVVLGTGVFFVMYTRAVALSRQEKTAPTAGTQSKGINKITVNTALIGLCLVYLLYLFSQLSYFVSGFFGIAPEGYTLAEYARRGFFEMAWLCAINMGLIVLAVMLVQKSGDTAPLSTRLLCLCLGLVTLFFVVVSSAKMVTYIGGYGLTRLRVMTQLIILFFGLMAVTVSVNLFLKAPRYMPVLLIGALLLGGTAFWVDVDTVVASYNVHAYQTGKLETVDVHYLGELSDGAIPYIAKLVSDKNPSVAQAAKDELVYRHVYLQDFREWNYAAWAAKPYLIDQSYNNGN